jgi:voltage-gated potassium channel Kch
MAFLFGCIAVALIVLVLVDSFETTILPRRVTHRYRLARLYYLSAWQVWRVLALRIRAAKTRESFLAVFGPLSLLGMLTIWVIVLIFAYALLHWSLETAVHSPDDHISFGTYLYWSGGTFFTLGYGDITPSGSIGRALAVIEAGMGFGFLALFISYVPVMYQTFSKREIMIGLLDARAGSPPSAAQWLIRVGQSGNLASLDPFLVEWERWSAEVLESHLSFPILSFYRSQHDNQSWLAALTSVLDACAVIIAAIKDVSPFQAQLTFAMARHTAVDLALVFKAPAQPPDIDRLPLERLEHLRQLLKESGFQLHELAATQTKLTELREMYEPFVYVLSQRFLFQLPDILPDHPDPDNWQRSAWMKRAPGISSLPIISTGEGHFA